MPRSKRPDTPCGEHTIRHEVYVPIVSETVGFIKWSLTFIVVVLLLAVLLYIPACTSNAVFGWPPLGDESLENKK
ncbi:MAG: hypothetical protein LBV12_10020 [Puniceicoccales bacterium]|jgi:hypothetical protein|nr:hypothetical protein [Puniceicoccales bacterium]